MLRILLAGTAVLLSATTAEARGFHADVFTGVDVVSDDGDSDTGALYGVGFGYDVERPGYFYGVELTAAGTSVRDCRRNVFLAGDRACARSETDSALVARAGARLANGTKLYGLAGFAVARLKATYRLGAVQASETQEPDGLRLGAGAELPLSRAIAAKIEYRYSNLDQGLERHQGVAGLSFAF